MKTILLVRIINCLGILCIILGFCVECRLLYLGTFLVMVGETLELSFIISGVIESKRLAKKYKNYLDDNY